MTADLAPWESAALADLDEPAVVQPMQQDDYDAIRDDIQAAYLRDHSRLTEFLDAALSCLGIIAQTAAEADNVLAADCLEQMGLHAKSGVPMYEPQGEAL